jgi:hypothetical protein
LNRLLRQVRITKRLERGKDNEYTQDEIYKGFQDRDGRECTERGKHTGGCKRKWDIPRLITKWKRQYLGGEFHGTKASDIELRKLKLKICELEQMVGKLTMENYLLKKEKDFAIQRRKESLSIITGPNLEEPRRGVSWWVYQGQPITTGLRKTWKKQSVTLILPMP